MNPNRLFILIAALAGLQMSQQGCPACVLLPKSPEEALTAPTNSTTPKP